MDNYETTYHTDYIPKSVEIWRHDNKKDVKKTEPIERAWHTNIVLGDGELGLNDQLINEYLNPEFATKHPKCTKRYFQTPVDLEVIRKHLARHKNSVYKVDYCGAADKKAEIYNPETHEFDLKGNIALTTYAAAYRHPLLLNKRSLNVVKNIRQPNNLRVCKAISNGVTEYGAVISALGGEITKDQIYGKITYPPCSIWTPESTIAALNK